MRCPDASSVRESRSAGDRTSSKRSLAAGNPDGQGWQGQPYGNGTVLLGALALSRRDTARAMSEENVEIVRLSYERFNRGEVDGFLELCAPEFEFRDLPALPGSGVTVGHDAFRAWFRQISDAFDDLRFEVEELIDAGDQVVVVNRATGSGSGSGAEVNTNFSNVWTLRDGKAVSAVSHDTHDEALEAAGLSE